MQKIIIDGYNVIHADDDLVRASHRSMREARDLLMGWLREFVSSRALNLTLVFDGAGGMTDSETVVPGRFQVLYSAGGVTADTVIVTTLRAQSNARQYIVVTSDMADIGRAVRSEGARVMSSPEFLEWLHQRDPEPDNSEGDEPVDVDYWLRQFERRKDEPSD
jgi:predicted RNA-binding protein with PIN domain